MVVKLNNLIERKWFEKYEKKYNITKDTLDKGIVLYDDTYIFTDDSNIYMYVDNENNVVKKGTNLPYHNEYSPLSNMWRILSKYYGLKDYESNILRKLFDDNIVTFGKLPSKNIEYDL